MERISSQSLPRVTRSSGAEAAGGLGDGVGLERLAQLVEFLEIAALGAADDGAVARDLLEHAFLLQALDGLTHRGAADADLAGEGVLGDDVAGGQFPGEEFAVDVFVGLIAEGVGGHRAGGGRYINTTGIPEQGNFLWVECRRAGKLKRRDAEAQRAQRRMNRKTGASSRYSTAGVPGDRP